LPNKRRVIVVIQRRQNDAMREFNRADLSGAEQVAHAAVLDALDKCGAMIAAGAV
jgi:hypothetical protein